MRKPCQTLLCTALLGTIPVLALAQPESSSEPQGGTFSAYGKVTKVTPIVIRERVVEPYEDCRIVREPQSRSYRTRPRHRIQPPHRVVRSIVGSLIGGAIGNQIGGGRGKDAMTVVGAIAGAKIANAPRRDYYDEQASYSQDSGYATGSVEQCTQTDRTRYVSQITGYRVRYRYNGDTYTKTTTEHPGKRIPLEVRVSPRISQPR